MESFYDQEVKETVADHQENIQQLLTDQQILENTVTHNEKTLTPNREYASRNTETKQVNNGTSEPQLNNLATSEPEVNVVKQQDAGQPNDIQHNGVQNENQHATPVAEAERSETSMSRATTEMSLDMELNGPSHDEREAQYLLVKCQLCSEDMRMPKLLPCLHSFCEPCLENYVKKLVDRSKTTTITCPLCHTVVHLARGKFNPRDYIESLPTSTLISTVLSKRAARTRLCNVCKSDVNKAVSWCGYCALAFCEEHLQYHKELTSLKTRHPTVSLDDIGRNKSTIMFPYSKCHFHKKEDLHLFCKEEWVPCCHVCRKMLHKTCDIHKGSVIPLPVAALKVKEGKQAKNLKKRLENIREGSEEVSEDRIKNLDELELQLRLGRESISTIRNSINEHLNQLEDELHDELTEIYERTRIDLEEERDAAEIKLRTVAYYQTLFENINIHSPDTQAISELSQLKDQTRHMENDIHSFKRKARNFEISITTYAEYFKQIAKMGSLQRREITAYKLAPVPAPTRTKTNLYKGSSGSKSTL